jgi:hypothetical protein
MIRIGCGGNSRCTRQPRQTQVAARAAIAIATRPPFTTNNSDDFSRIVQTTDADWIAVGDGIGQVASGSGVNERDIFQDREKGPLHAFRS